MRVLRATITYLFVKVQHGIKVVEHITVRVRCCERKIAEAGRTKRIECFCATPAYRLITNVRASTSKGLESYVELNAARAFFSNIKADLILFSSYSYTNAKDTSNAEKGNNKIGGEIKWRTRRRIYFGEVFLQDIRIC